MAYYPLQFSSNTPKRVRDHIERYWLGAWLQEAHWLLLHRETEPGVFLMPFTFVTALRLLEMIGGISKVYYGHSSQEPGERFKALLKNYYPWDLEPAAGADATSGPRLLYEAFRNPFAHTLGVPDQTIGGTGLCAYSFSEADLEALERSATRPLFAEKTLGIYPDGRLSLHIPGLYWGLRKMICRLTDDAAMMTRVVEGLDNF